jgi:DNA processing protein
MEQTELSAWLRLMLTDGVGNNTARKLLATFGLPTSIFEQPITALGQVVTERQAQALQRTPEGLDKQITLCNEWLAQDARTGNRTRRVVSLGDALYPSALLTLPDPPLVLWLLGRIDLLDAGLCVVSGMALGIDAAAHSGALNAGKFDGSPDSLLTIAVVGTGLDRVYPKQNLELAHRIADHGLVVSEFPLGSPPTAANFPKRNRLIAALGLGTLVVEAALQSGSLITARECLEVGKDVFAIPGSIHVAQSKGCHALIKQGAKLVESAADVLEELRINTSGSNNNASAGQYQQGLQGISPAHAQHPLVLAMGFDPVSFDVLQARVDMDAATLQVQLLELELDNVIIRVPGGLYQVAL